MSILASVIIPLLLILVINSKKLSVFSRISRKGLLTLFSIKIIAGLCMWAIYSFYYSPRNTSDAFRFFDDAEMMYSTINVDPGIYFKMLSGINDDSPEIQHYYDEMNSWVKPVEDNVYNDNRIIIRINAFFMLFSQKSYLVHIFLFCFIGFIGQIFLFKSLIKAFPQHFLASIISVFLLPSVLFWSSGILKEPILMLALGYLVYYIFNFSDKAKGNIFFALLSVLLLTYLKFYILIILIPATIGFLFSKRLGAKRALIIPGSFLILYIITFLVSSFVLDFNIFEIIARKQHDFIKVAEAWKAGSAIQIPTLSASPFSVIINSPVAFFNTLLRPFIWEGKNPFMLIAAIENLFFITLIILAARHFSRSKINDQYVIFMLIFTIGLFVLIGLVTPIVGAMVRYKIPALPFLTITLFLFIPKTVLNSYFDNILTRTQNFFEK